MRRISLLFASLFLLLSCALFAQVNTAPFPNPVPQFFDANGAPLSGGKLFSFSAGTTAPLATYTDGTGLVQNQNPIILNAAGFPVNSSGSIVGVWLGPQKYKLILQNSLGVQQWSVDQVGGNNLFSLANLTMAESTAPSCNIGADILWADSAGHRYKMCNNNGSADYVVGQNTPDILTNKTLINPALTTPTITNETTTGTGNHLGTDNFLSFNRRQMCDQYPGATFDIKVNACIQAVISQGGGTADASGLIGTQTQSAEIDVGNVSSVPVTLITSPFLIDNITINSAGACAFKVFNESRMMGTMHGITHSGVFQVTGSSAMSAVICSAGSAPSYISIQGAQIYNPNGATFTNGAVYAYNLFDSSEFRDLMIASYGTIGLRVRAACCGTTISNNVIDGGHIANSIPLQIDSLAGDPQPVAGVQFLANSIDHPGTGKNNIVINNTFASSGSACSIEFFGLYMESNNTDTTTPFVSDVGCNRTSWTGITVQSRAAASTQQVWSLTAGGGGSLRPRITVKGFNFFNSTQTFPTAVVNDVNFPALIMSDSIGGLSNWDNRMSWLAGGAFPEQNAAGAEAVAEVAADICYGDSTSHTLKCSYNNGSFFNLTQTIGTGTSTSNGTAIASGVSQAQPAITITGAAVTDVAVCALNAAPVATWQTGIQLLPAVVTSNTVTPWLSNPSAGSITPAAAVIRCTVTR